MERHKVQSFVMLPLFASTLIWAGGFIYFQQKKIPLSREFASGQCNLIPFDKVVRDYRASMTGKNQVRVLVTGGAGFIGSHVADFCQNNLGFHVIVVDDMSGGFKSNTDDFTLGGGVFVVGNLQDDKFLESLFS